MKEHEERQSGIIQFPFVCCVCLCVVDCLLLPCSCHTKAEIKILPV